MNHHCWAAYDAGNLVFLELRAAYADDIIEKRQLYSTPSQTNETDGSYMKTLLLGVEY